MLVDLTPSPILRLCPYIYKLAWMQPLKAPQEEWPYPHLAVTVLKASATAGAETMGVGAQDRELCRGRVQKGELREGDVCLNAFRNGSFMVSLLSLPAQLRSSGQPAWGTSAPGSVYNDLGNVYINDLGVYSQGEWPKVLNLKSLKCFYLYFCDIRRSRDRGNVGVLRQPLNIPDE